MIKRITLSIAFVFVVTCFYAQFGYGLTFSNDIYQRYSNPEDDIAYGAAGSFMLNFGIGPKIWVGGSDVSFSLETQAQIGLLGLAFKDYKGLGMHSVPIIARINFKGLSGLDREGRIGWSLGGGIQYNKTELFYLANKYEDQGLDRNYFKTYVGQVALGFGMSGFVGQAVLRIGYNSETKASSLNLGIQFDFNIPKLKEITDPESDL